MNKWSFLNKFVTSVSKWSYEEIVQTFMHESGLHLTCVYIHRRASLIAGKFHSILVSVAGIHEWRRKWIITVLKNWWRVTWIKREESQSRWRYEGKNWGKFFRVISVCVIQAGDICLRTDPGVSRMMRVISDIPYFGPVWPCRGPNLCFKNMFCDSLSLKCVVFA